MGPDLSPELCIHGWGVVFCVVVENVTGEGIASILSVPDESPLSDLSLGCEYLCIPLRGIYVRCRPC